MTVFTGSNGSITWSGGSPILYYSDFTVDINQDIEKIAYMIAAATPNPNWKTKTQGAIEWSVSFNGWMDNGAGAYDMLDWGAVDASTTFTLAAGKSFAGSGQIARQSITGRQGAAVSITGTFEGSGALVQTW